MISIAVKRVTNWPALAWVCKVEREPASVRTWCGSRVEQIGNAIFEAAWDGSVAPITLDSSSLVIGTGFILREKNITFVPSSNTVDRIWFIKEKFGGWVSNSLSALLATSGAQLRDDYFLYNRDLATIVHGIDRYKQHVPLKNGEAEVIYYQNLVFDWDNWRREDKTDHTPSFDTFDAYYTYLLDTASRLASNATTRHRKFPLELLTTISTGYDSPTAAVVAKHAGCRKALTLTRARSRFHRSDSGMRIADRLNLECDAYDNHKAITSEPYFWSVLGEPADANLSVFQFPDAPSVLFTGFNGGILWDIQEHKLSNRCVRKDLTGLGLCEYRLHAQFLHCPVPFWGIMRAAEIQKLSISPSLKPWSIGGKYNRPICRRIVEDAGVPRDWFGIKKKATTLSPHAERRPITRDARERFELFVRERNIPVTPNWILRLSNQIDEDIMSHIRDITGTKLPKTWINSKAEKMAFQWAVNEIAFMYREGLKNEHSSSPEVC